MGYFIGGNGKVLTNEMSEAEPSAFNGPTDAYRRCTLAELQAQVDKDNHTHTAPVTWRAMSQTTRGGVPLSVTQAHDRLRAKGMAETRLRSLFPDVYGIEKRTRETSCIVLGNISLQ